MPEKQCGLQEAAGRVPGVTVEEFFSTTADARKEASETGAVWLVTEDSVYVPMGASITAEGDLCIHITQVARVPEEEPQQ